MSCGGIEMALHSRGCVDRCGGKCHTDSIVFVSPARSEAHSHPSFPARFHWFLAGNCASNGQAGHILSGFGGNTFARYASTFLRFFLLSSLVILFSFLRLVHFVLELLEPSLLLSGALLAVVEALHAVRSVGGLGPSLLLAALLQLY